MLNRDVFVHRPSLGLSTSLFGMHLCSSSFYLQTGCTPHTLLREFPNFRFG